jgi:hypothetical protein
MNRNSFQQSAENPLIDLLAQCGRHLDETDTALPGKRRTYDLSTGLHLQTWIAEFKAHPYLLLRAYCGDHLYTDAGTRQIAHDAAVRLVERDVSQRSQIVPMRCSCLTRGSESCVHIHRRKSRGQRVVTRMLSAIGEGLSNKDGSERQWSVVRRQAAVYIENWPLNTDHWPLVSSPRKASRARLPEACQILTASKTTTVP